MQLSRLTYIIYSLASRKELSASCRFLPFFNKFFFSFILHPEQKKIYTIFFDPLAMQKVKNAEVAWRIVPRAPHAGALLKQAVSTYWNVFDFSSNGRNFFFSLYSNHGKILLTQLYLVLGLPKNICLDKQENPWYSGTTFGDSSFFAYNENIILFSVVLKLLNTHIFSFSKWFRVSRLMFSMKN